MVAPTGKEQLNVELAKTLLNLVFVGLAAMLIKAVVDQFVAARERERQEAMQQEADARRAAATEQERARRIARCYVFGDALGLKVKTTKKGGRRRS